MKTKMDLTEKTVHIPGPTMAWILGRAMTTTNDDEVHAIFGDFKVSNKNVISDSSTSKAIKSIDVSVKFMTGLPLKCWDPTQKVWNHGAFKEWEASVKAHLGLSGHVVVGLARFRRSDGLLMSAPFALRDVKLCQYLSGQERTPTILMAINSPNKERELTSTSVTTAYFNTNGKEFDYINLKVGNLGQEAASYFGAGNSSSFEPKELIPLSRETAQLCSKLQKVHDEYQQKQLHLVRKMEKDSLLQESPAKKMKI